MKVAVQNEKIKEELAMRGFNVIDYNSPDADAVVYEGSIGGVMERDDMRGTFLVNAKGKSCDEIARILTKRLYTPLF